MKTKNLPACFLILFISEISPAQVTFQKTYGGTGLDQSASIEQTTDGGYIISGQTNSFGTGNYDIYLIKADNNGDTLWTKTFGGMDIEGGTAIQQTTDGGFIIGGNSTSFGSGSSDIYLIKTDANGNILWEKNIGGTDADYCNSVKQTMDGGYIATGYTFIVGAGYGDIRLIKTNAIGNLMWMKTFGGASNLDRGFSLQQTTDGGYVICGLTNSFGAGGGDIYLIKTDLNGDSLWTKTFGGIGGEEGRSIQQTIDGGYIITGSTLSFGSGANDVYLIKSDSSGNTIWSKTFGGTANDGGFFVQQTLDSGYIITGSTSNFGAGNVDVYLIKTDVNGDTLWTKTFGGVSDELGASVRQTTDGGYIVTGYTESFGSGNRDIYLIKTDNLGKSGCNENSTATNVNISATQVTSPATIVTSPPTIVTIPPTLVSSGGTVTTLCTTVGIQAASASGGPQSEISISPNPFHTTATISLNEIFSSPDLTFEIFNVEGKTIRKFPITSDKTSINRNGLANGFYFYKLSDKEVVKSTGKLVIQ